jgi:LacI family transcriptional regulator
MKVIEKKKKEKYLSIRDIAKLANVSTATVSRVLNKPESTSKATQEKVLKVVKQYEYVPNISAKNVFSKTYNSIALFVYDIKNPFFNILISKLNSICSANNYTFLIFDTENKVNNEKKYLDYCLANNVDGIIVTEGINYSLFSNTNMLPTIVTLDRYLENFSAVKSENIKATKNSVSYLCNLNHKKIAFVGCSNKFESTEERKEGYIEALQEKGIEICNDYIYEKFPNLNLENGKNALKHFLTLDEVPTAIICSNDMIALGIISTANLFNIRIPEDISIIGFDDILGDFHYPGITTVKQDIDSIADNLFNLIANPSKENKHIVIKTKLVQGYTTCRSKE